MATTRASATYADQPYFNKANDRPTVPRADNENSAPRGNKVTQGPWGKATTTYTSANSPVRTAKSNDEIFNETYAKAGIQTPLNRADRTQKASVTYGQAAQAKTKSLVRNSSAYGIKQLKKQTKVTKLIGLQRLKVTTANTWIGGWAVFWYLSFQLPLAVISAAGLGILYAVYAIVDTFVGETVVGTAVFFIFGEDSFAAIGSKVVSVALKVFGIEFDPILLFMVPFTLVFLLGLVQLILSWFIYTTLGIKSLSGKAAGIKGIMFMIAGIGYAIPVLNMFPLIFLWMVVVWIHPK